MGGQNGVKVDGSHKRNLNGTQKCVGGPKWVEVDGPKIMKVNGHRRRGWSKRGESGRSTKNKSKRSKNAWVIKKG